jgi:hypothetical protein
MLLGFECTISVPRTLESHTSCICYEEWKLGGGLWHFTSFVLQAPSLRCSCIWAAPKKKVVCSPKQRVYTASQTRLTSLFSLPLEPQITHDWLTDWLANKETNQPAKSVVQCLSWIAEMKPMKKFSRFYGTVRLLTDTGPCPNVGESIPPPLTIFP